MKSKENIINCLKSGKLLTATEIASRLGVSRQAVSRHLQALISEGLVVKHGKTRGASFGLSKVRNSQAHTNSIEKSFTLAGLEEDKVFETFSSLLDLQKILTAESFAIIQYAFTEILNNSIDHSKDKSCKVACRIDSHKIEFNIKDGGIGAFNSIYSKFNLPDEVEAAAELLKGKTTTMRSRHSGEGIFFTSKAVDVFSLRSHRLVLNFDNIKNSVSVSQKRFIKGTDVSFSLSLRIRRKLNDIFETYAPEEFDYSFEKTLVRVNVFRKECISRSEAKRLVSKLDNFSEITLDFKGVDTIGQAFADEVFRVFLNAHQTLCFKIINLKPALKAMINHVLNIKTAERVEFC
jgi:biotin operon repressor/anti-sigma regulatory factor (Ser/Thr protein kinase)